MTSHTDESPAALVAGPEPVVPSSVEHAVPRWRRGADVLLERLGVRPRPYFALVWSLLVMDLRGQHFARATATKPKHVLSPLFLVIGQCLTLSAVSSLFLFLRVDVFFYALVGIGSSMLVLATALFVEFSEVILDPEDLHILGHRPVPPRTYAAARLTNLLVYVALIWTALNLFPALLGAGLRDAGAWYLPAYLAASFAGGALTVCFVVLSVSAKGAGPWMDEWRELCAWTQIVLILVAGYGGQLMLRDKTHALELWAAFPPAWVEWLPPAWLARFVEAAAVAPTRDVLWHGAGWVSVALGSAWLTYLRVLSLYRTMRPMESPLSRKRRGMVDVGTIASGWMRLLGRTRDQRLGLWIVAHQLRHDTSLRIRSLLPLNATLVAMVMGVLTSQFANPMTTRDPSLSALTLAAVYFLPLAVPSILYHLTFSDHSDAAWIFRAAPSAEAAGLARGVARAVLALVVTPAAIVLGLVMWRQWGDATAALLHAGTAWIVSWPVAIASLRYVVPADPLSLPTARGGSLGPLAIPMAAFSGVLSIVAGLHALFCSHAGFWISLFAACAVAAWWIGRGVEARWTRLRESSE